MKYEVGQKVKIKNLDWYNRHTNGIEVDCGEYSFTSDMKEFCGQEKIIANVCEDCYFLLGIDDKFVFTDEMIEGLAEEPVWSAPNITEGVFIHEKDMKWTTEYILPDGYIFKDENGNVINATKIVLEKKKKEYPKTYQECCKVMGVNHTNDLDICEHCDYKTEITYYEDSLLEKIETLYRLIICRDAYWKLAGEEMGLGKPWEPVWNDTSIKYCLERDFDAIDKNISNHKGRTFAFPTAEMRDAFKENFDPGIEFCKEFL